MHKCLRLLSESHQKRNLHNPRMYSSKFTTITTQYVHAARFRSWLCPSTETSVDGHSLIPRVERRCLMTHQNGTKIDRMNTFSLKKCHIDAGIRNLLHSLGIRQIMIQWPNRARFAFFFSFGCSRESRKSSHRRMPEPISALCPLSTLTVSGNKRIRSLYLIFLLRLPSYRDIVLLAIRMALWAESTPRIRSFIMCTGNATPFGTRHSAIVFPIGACEIFCFHNWQSYCSRMESHEPDQCGDSSIAVILSLI